MLETIKKLLQTTTRRKTKIYKAKQKKLVRMEKIC